MNGKIIFFDLILNVTVFGSLITSIANIIVSLINNYKLKQIENKKEINQIDTYRYSRLYELIVDWHKYDSNTKGKTASEIAFYKSLNLFMDDLKRYEIAKPLLEDSYILNLKNKKIEGEKLLQTLIMSETPDGTHTEDFPIIRDKYFQCGREFSELVKETINNQIEELLKRSKIK